jgi:hypothetical protein
MLGRLAGRHHRIHATDSETALALHAEEGLGAASQSDGGGDEL